MLLQFEHTKYGLLAIVSGELDLRVVDELKHALIREMDCYKGKNLILDLANVNFIDSSGLAVILGRYRQLALVGGNLKIVGVNEQVYRILHLSGLTRFITVERAQHAKVLRRKYDAGKQR